MDTERHFPHSVIMADLKGLNLVNDSYRHNDGDEMHEVVAGIPRAQGDMYQETFLESR